MKWLEYVEQILDFQLFQLGGNAITVLHVAMFVFVLIVTYVLAHSVRRFLTRYVLAEVEPAPRYVIVRFTQYLVWIVGLAVAVELLNVDLTALTVVAGAFGIGIGFGLQNVVNNLVSGVVLLFEQPVRYRDRVSVENVEGQVENINFRATTILTNDNISIIVPNSQLINQTVINWSHGDPRIRVHVPVGVAYGSDVELVTETLLAVAREQPDVLPAPESEVRFLEFGDSSLNFELLVWSDEPPNYHRLRSKLNYAIDAAFRDKGVEIPFPQRDLHIKTPSPEDITKTFSK
ncbi:MAG: mechanosensitive ion channel [Acidobacteriota bacterium]|nr:MAG: mechanosensitive ion channel [Acidobacteriota bacterium]